MSKFVKALHLIGVVAAGALPMIQLHVVEGREAAFGAVNVLLCLTMVFIAVVKPRIGNVKP